MIDDPNSNGTFDIPRGIRTQLNINRPCKFIIKTTMGTIIEGATNPAAPIAITAGPDIKSIDLIIDDESIMPLHLVE